MSISFSLPTLLLILILILITLSLSSSSDSDADYAKSLLKFKQSLTNAHALADWSLPADALCSNYTPIWTGLVCKNGSLNGLRLENMSLGGTVDVGALSELPLFSLSVNNNNFSGAFPGDINRLGKLRRLFLGNNSFAGEIPEDAFDGMKNLWQVELGFNEFDGEIPASLARVPRLKFLQAQSNRFEGRIPEFSQSNLTVDLADNRLEGAIPASLRTQNVTSFSGNPDLCGAPLSRRCKPKPSVKAIALIAAAAAAVALAAFLILFLLCRRRRSKSSKPEKPANKFQTKDNDVVTYKNGEHGKLQFVRDDREKFELEDLLRASAEVLGSGSFGSSYKAVLLTGQLYVVRRFRQMNGASKEEFYEHMRRLGRLSHPNLLPLVGFYYRKEEKLLITDFVDNGSLASHLHGKRTDNKPSLDWPTRLKIIKGVARGLSHLYIQLPTLALPHGHLKSSNVLLTAAHDPILSDYALTPVTNKDHAQHFMVAYKSPESVQNDAVSRKTDVWSLGILILEALTGRFPTNYLKKGREPGADLAAWVNSVVREEWTGEVFDKEMSVGRNGEGQMLRLLKIGMCCCEWNVERRWGLAEAAEKIEEVRERDGDEDYSTSYASDADMHSSAALTDEDFSFSRA